MTFLRFFFRTFVAMAMGLALGSARAAGPVEFVEIPWGATMAAAKRTIQARESVTFEGESDTRLSFTGGTFANEKVSTWRLEFTDGKFRSATVSFVMETATDERRFLNDRLEDRVVRLIEDKYGKPRRATDGSHREYNWSFPDALRPGWTRTIRFLHGWSPERKLEVTYADVPPTPPKKTKDI